MKKFLALILALSMAFALCGCGHQHTWVEASCTEPKTCRECGKTEGEALGHTWVEATKTAPKTCSRCGKTEGTPLTPDPVFFEEYPNLRTPESIAGITFITKTDDNYYKYSLGSDRNKAEDLLTQYASDVLISDGYLILPYPENKNFYAIYDGGTDSSNIRGLLGFSKEGNDIILTIGFLK